MSICRTCYQGCTTGTRVLTQGQLIVTYAEKHYPESHLTDYHVKVCIQWAVIIPDIHTPCRWQHINFSHTMWCGLGKSVWSRTCDIFSLVFYLIEVLIWRGTFCWKPHLNRTSGSKVMSNWMILKSKRNSFLPGNIS